ncbi:MAG: LysM peptidoglycan-binding domain-containing protein [Actinomycetota bacterium]|nr:LysM peptidoglycan-binding domain-containing protein [Actinomycetota bacterium]
MASATVDDNSVSRVWWQLLGSIAAVAALAMLLPMPWAAIGAVTRSAKAGPDASAVAQTAMLAIASTAVWILLVWSATVAFCAGIGRLPGAAGAVGRLILARIAPALARRLVLTVVGAAMVSGVAGYGTAAAATTSGSSHQANAHQGNASGQQLVGSADPARSWIAVEGSTVQLGAGSTQPRSGAVTDLGSVNLDWPDGRAADQLGGIPGPQDAPTPAPTARTHPAARSDPAGDRAEKQPAPAVNVDWPSGTGVRGGEVVVLRSDSLWSIAARHLPGDASDAEIDRTWHQWYSANSAVLGSDPNLIFPGQILLAPTLGTDDRP